MTDLSLSLDLVAGLLTIVYLIGALLAATAGSSSNTEESFCGTGGRSSSGILSQALLREKRSLAGQDVWRRA